MNNVFYPKTSFPDLDLDQKIENTLVEVDIKTVLHIHDINNPFFKIKRNYIPLPNHLHMILSFIIIIVISEVVIIFIYFHLFQVYLCCRLIKRTSDGTYHPHNH